jgi:rhodanese-related sulfurtransferase
MRYISVVDAHAKIQKNELVLLDIREAYEYDICSIEAIQIPMAEVAARVNEIPTDIEVAVKKG